MRITRAEFAMMEVVWRLGQATVKDVVDNLPSDRSLAYTTVMTVLQRLRRKGALSQRKSSSGGRAYVYTPLVTKEQVLSQAVRDLVEGYFHGSFHDLGLFLRRQEAQTEIEQPAQTVTASATADSTSTMGKDLTPELL